MTPGIDREARRLFGRGAISGTAQRLCSTALGFFCAVPLSATCSTRNDASPFARLPRLPHMKKQRLYRPYKREPELNHGHHVLQTLVDDGKIYQKPSAERRPGSRGEMTGRERPPQHSASLRSLA
jgi:hypothetical protein